MIGAEQALATLRDYVERSTHWREGGATRHEALTVALPALEEGFDWLGKGVAEWRSLALATQAQVKHQSGQRESELVTLLKDILHCSDALAFRPDLHARLLDFGRRLKAQEPKDDFPDDYEV